MWIGYYFAYGIREKTNLSLMERIWRGLVVTHSY